MSDGPIDATDSSNRGDTHGGQQHAGGPDAAVQIRPAVEADVPVIFGFIRELAEYEHLSHAVVATEEGLRKTLFGPRAFAEILIGSIPDEPAIARRQSSGVESPAVESGAVEDDAVESGNVESGDVESPAAAPPMIPVGFALFFHNYSTFVGKPGIYLEDLYVQPRARGKGVGKALLTRVAQLAVRRDCGRLEWSVLDWNEPSIGFYKKLGAVPMDDWTIFRVAGEALAKLGGE